MASDNPELKKGMFITVVEWTSHKDNSYKGDCLEVLVVDKTLIRVERADVKAGSFLGGPFTLDLNRVIVRELSAEFVANCIESVKEKEAS